MSEENSTKKPDEVAPEIFVKTCPLCPADKTKFTSNDKNGKGIVSQLLAEHLEKAHPEPIPENDNESIDDSLEKLDQKSEIKKNKKNFRAQCKLCSVKVDSVTQEGLEQLLKIHNLKHKESNTNSSGDVKSKGSNALWGFVGVTFFIGMILTGLIFGGNYIRNQGLKLSDDEKEKGI